MSDIKAPETQEDRWRGVQADMKEMFEEANSFGVWFYCYSQQLWFSPDELAAHQRVGSFRWGSGSFKLRDPTSRLAELQSNVEKAQLDLEKFVARMRAIHEN